MPIYEYVCDDCRARFEQIVLSKGQGVTCPNCGSARHTLQLSVFSAGRGDAASSARAAEFPPAGACGRGTCGCR